MHRDGAGTGSSQRCALVVSDEDFAREEQQPSQYGQGADGERDQHRRRVVVLGETSDAREHESSQQYDRAEVWDRHHVDQHQGEQAEGERPDGELACDGGGLERGGLHGCGRRRVNDAGRRLCPMVHDGVDAEACHCQDEKWKQEHHTLPSTRDSLEVGESLSLCAPLGEAPRVGCPARQRRTTAR